MLLLLLLFLVMGGIMAAAKVLELARASWRDAFTSWSSFGATVAGAVVFGSIGALWFYLILGVWGEIVIEYRNALRDPGFWLYHALLAAVGAFFLGMWAADRSREP